MAGKKIFIIGFICFIMICTSAVLMHYFFQVGHPANNVKNHTLNALWLTFGKIIFVASVMLGLISLCQSNKAFPQMVANNASIQLIGNLSFSIYCWHFIV